MLHVWSISYKISMTSFLLSIMPGNFVLNTSICAGHFTLDALASRPVACFSIGVASIMHACLPNGRIQVCCAGLCGGVRFIWGFNSKGTQKNFQKMKRISKCCLQSGNHFVKHSDCVTLNIASYIDPKPLFKTTPPHTQPTQRHQTECCDLLCNLIGMRLSSSAAEGSAAVLQTYLQHFKANVCVICVPDYVYMTR